MNEIVVKNNIRVENLIYEVRGKQVMLDSDLALLYGTETKRINEAVKNNPLKFPERYSFKLTNEEVEIFLVENFDQKKETRGGRYKNPRVFTEEGVAMLATTLNTKFAINVGLRILDAFVTIHKYSPNYMKEQTYYNDLTLIHHLKIKVLQDLLKKYES